MLTKLLPSLLNPAKTKTSPSYTNRCLPKDSFFIRFAGITQPYRPQYLYHLTTEADLERILKDQMISLHKPDDVEPVTGIFTIDEKDLHQGWSKDYFPLSNNEGRASGLSGIILLLREKQQFDPTQPLILLKILVDPSDQLIVRDAAHPMKIGESTSQEEFDRKIAELHANYIEYSWDDPNKPPMEYPEYILKNPIPIARVSVSRTIPTSQLDLQTILSQPEKVAYIVLGTND